MFQCLWSPVESLPAPGSEAPLSAGPHSPTLDILLHNPDTDHAFCLVVNSRSKLCLHVCRTLVNLVKAHIGKNKQGSDILGLLLIIFQYDTRQFREELELVVSTIQSMKTFKYKRLLDHITEVDVLEELVHLVQHHDTRLDVLDSKKRYSKEDALASIVQRVQHCTDNSEEYVMAFIFHYREEIETKFTQYAGN